VNYLQSEALVSGDSYVVHVTSAVLMAGVCVTVGRAVTDPRNGRRVAIKKLPNVFHSLVSCKRVYRELKMLCTFQHENVSLLS